MISVVCQCELLVHSNEEVSPASLEFVFFVFLGSYVTKKCHNPKPGHQLRYPLQCEALHRHGMRLVLSASRGNL